MIDCGTDWLTSLHSVAPTAIVLTHAHPDHAFGLARGAPCPVYATAATWALIDAYPLDERLLVAPRAPFRVGGIGFEAFPVEHSLRAPAVGYRVSAGRHSFFYVPDVASIPDQRAALRGVDFYVGDGATIKRSMVRHRDHILIGHAPIAAQILWCAQEKVGRAVFTHCGSEIVRGEGRAVAARVRALGEAHGVEARLAHDGLTLTLGGAW
jgi:phosphoribosyl 1,2-cyclic phosphodiesterase